MATPQAMEEAKEMVEIVAIKVVAKETTNLTTKATATVTKMGATTMTIVKVGAIIMTTGTTMGAITRTGPTRSSSTCGGFSLYLLILQDKACIDQNNVSGPRLEPMSSSALCLNLTSYAFHHHG